MGRYNFTTDEMMKGDPDVMSREIGKFLKDPNTPLKTTASIAGGNQDFLSTLSVGQVLMGVPATNDNDYVASLQDKVFTNLTDAALASDSGGKAGTLQVNGQKQTTPFDYIVPGDITSDAKTWVSKAPQSDAGSGTGTGGATTTTGGGTTGLPATSSTGPTNQAFLTQLRGMFGVPYLAQNPQRFGPSFYDCSGFVYTGLRKIGITDPQLPTTSDAQWQWCANHGLSITVDQAIATPGALLFIWNHHIAVSDGTGNAYQAVGHAYLSGSYSARNFGPSFDRAGLVAGMQYVDNNNQPLSGIPVGK